MDNENNNINFRLINEEENNNQNNNFNRKKERSRLSYFTVSLISAIIGGLIVSLFTPIIHKNINQASNIKDFGQEITITPSDDINTVAAVAKKSMKSVVGITTVETVKVQDFFFRQYERQVEGVGSGVIVDSNGYILTNAHVVGDGSADNITVLFENGEKKSAEILWFEKSLDLAILKVEGSNYPAADLGDSDNLTIGEIAVAIGNPLGLEFERTVTDGIISGLNRTIQLDNNNTIENLIQTNASINSGNSGGPLLNARGEVIGINTLKLTRGEGLGFSIPINVAKPIIEQVINNGKYNGAYVGIYGHSVERYNAVGMDVGVEYGIVVSQVEENSPAHKAGIKNMNIIVSLDGIKIPSLDALRKELYKYQPGDRVKIGLIKEGKKVEVELVLGEKNE